MKEEVRFLRRHPIQCAVVFGVVGIASFLLSYHTSRWVGLGGVFLLWAGGVGWLSWAADVEWWEGQGARRGAQDGQDGARGGGEG